MCSRCWDCLFVRQFTFESLQIRPFRKGVTIQLHISNHTSCPFSAIKKYLTVTRGRETPFCLSDPLFIKEDGCALDREFFITSLKHILDICGYNSNLYNGHSFRIGASTSAWSVNIQDHLIKTLGRWSSDNSSCSDNQRFDIVTF
jgi:hypothetical protein